MTSFDFVQYYITATYLLLGVMMGWFCCVDLMRSTYPQPTVEVTIPPLPEHPEDEYFAVVGGVKGKDEYVKDILNLVEASTRLNIIFRQLGYDLSFYMQYSEIVDKLYLKETDDMKLMDINEYFDNITEFIDKSCSLNLAKILNEINDMTYNAWVSITNNSPTVRVVGLRDAIQNATYLRT